MGRKRNKKQPSKSFLKKHASEPDVTPEEAVKILREEILSEVRALSEGKIRSIYGLIQKDKELVELEESIKPKKKEEAPAKKPEPTQVSASDF